MERAMKMKKNTLAKILTIVGGIAMAVGSIDPMEGSLLIFPGSGLLALGTYLGGAERRDVRFKVASFVLLAIAFAALWGFTFVGGVGGATGRSIWWMALPIVPYLIGWNMGIWGPGSPRWLLWLGAAIGAMFIFDATVFAFKHSNIAPVFAVFGIVPLIACLLRLRNFKPSAPPAVA